jgi:predicted AlkP superfamily phosphohydrolase/phosphomutase
MSDNTSGRVVLLGFDGMDYDLTKELIDGGHLPNLKKMSDTGGFSPLLSVFPPDSIPSWITTYTGIDPSEHGILEHVNYLLDKEGETSIDTSVFHEKTFWDRIGNETDTEVCIINPFMAYPVWNVNGVMVNGPSFIKGPIQSSNDDYLYGIKIPDSIGGIEDLPSRSTIQPFYEKTVSDTEEQAEFGLDIFRNKKPGFFFQTFLTTDRLQHHLWRYCDKNDPTYPGENEVETGIKDFFVLVDNIVGQFMNELSDDDTLIIMSDHGHGMRCTHCFNLNELLRRKGYLKSAGGEKKFNKKILLEKLKNRVLKFMNDHDLEEYMAKIAKYVPNAKALKKGSHITNYSDSMAYASDFAGTNPFGGICINKENVDDYESFRNQLMKELNDCQYNGKPVFRWMKHREDLYQGSHIDRYPDILFEMVPELGSGMSMHTDLFTVNPTHKKVSGGHKKNGIFFVNQTSKLNINPKECKITNMHETLISLYNLSGKSNTSKSFLKSR